MHLGFGFGDIARLSDEQSRSITAENPNGVVGAGGRAASDLGDARKGRPCLRDVEPGAVEPLAEIDGPGVIRHIWITVPDRTDAGDHVLRDVVLRCFWDDETEPSVEVPLGDFFCCGFGRRARVNSIPIVVAPSGGMNSYWPMPFQSAARIEIENQHDGPIPAFFFQIDYGLGTVANDVAYFHASWRRENPSVPATDITIADDIAGRGHFVGAYLAWSALADHWWGEGEMKAYIDGDEEYPTICGTGTEDYVGGAWCFIPPGADEPARYSTPFLGYPTFDPGAGSQGRPPRHGLYRWHLPDPIRFTEDLRVTIQQIGHDGRGLFERSDDVSATAYWYQQEPHTPLPGLDDPVSRRPR